MLRLQQQHTKPNSAVRSIYLIDEARARFEVGEKTVAVRLTFAVLFFSWWRRNVQEGVSPKHYDE